MNKMLKIKYDNIVNYEKYNDAYKHFDEYFEQNDVMLYYIVYWQYEKLTIEQKEKIDAWKVLQKLSGGDLNE